eukprot:461419_1
MNRACQQQKICRSKVMKTIHFGHVAHHFPIRLKIHHISHVSNLIVVAGNVLGRTMSDSGAFTHCICQSFRHNLANTFKANLNTLMIDIGRNLEKITNGVEICTVSGNQRYNQIRFMKNKAEKPHSKAIQNEEDNVEMCYYLLEEDECI